MKKLNKQLSRRVLKELNRDANFKDVYQMVSNRAKTKPYLVGGKLYRTIIEVMYDYPARSRSADFDFAAEEIRTKKKKRRVRLDIDGTPIEPTGAAISPSMYSGESIKMTSLHGCPIDLINIPDLKGLDGASPDINGYLSSVPLSIQSIAMDLEKCIIFGKVGIESINERFVWINNQGALDGLVKHKRWRDGNLYIQDKAKSIRFGWDKKVRAPKRNNGYKPYVNTFAEMNWNTGQIAIGNGAVATGENTIAFGNSHTITNTADIIANWQTLGDVVTENAEGPLQVTMGNVIYQLGANNQWETTDGVAI